MLLDGCSCLDKSVQVYCGSGSVCGVPRTCPLPMHTRCAVCLQIGGKVAGVCRRAISIMSMDQCSYPHDSVLVYRVPCDCPSHVPFWSVVFAFRSLTTISHYTSVNLCLSPRANTTEARLVHVSVALPFSL